METEPETARRGRLGALTENALPDGLGSMARGRRLAWAATALIAGLALAAVIAISALRQGAISDTQKENHRLGVVLAEETARTVQAVDSVLRELSGKIAAGEVADLDALHARFGGIDVHDALARRLVDLPQVSAFAILDATGHFVSDSGHWPVPDYSNFGRSYFQRSAASSDAGPFISEPLLSRSLGIRTVVLSRRLNAPDGTLLGIVMAPIRLEYFETLLAKAGLDDGSAVSIVRRDGLLLVHFPIAGVAPDQVVPARSPWHQMVGAGGGTYRSSGIFGTLGAGFVSVHPLEAYPLVVDVVRSQAAALARWRHQSVAIACSALAATLCMALLLRALLRQIAITQASAAQIGLQAAAVKASEARLTTTLEHMNQGIVMVDADGRIAFCNRRAMEILDLPAKMMAAQPSFEEVIAYQRQRGEFGASSSAALDAPMLLSKDACYERRRPNGTVLEVRTAALPDGGLVRTYTDITARAAAEAMVSLAATHDPLTGLCNRNGFHARMDAALLTARCNGTELALLCLDLDHFKTVNDTLGHAAGDQLLIAVAQRMRDIGRGSDIICRLGGDEFAVVLPGSALDGAEHVSHRLIEAIHAPYSLGNETARIGVSIGIAISPGDGSTAEQLMRNADAALYAAKAAGRNTWRAFGAEDGQREHRRKQLEQDLRTAVEQEAFTLAYQPLCDAATREPVAFEALLRWNHPTRGALSPADFLPIAEQTGLIGPLGHWVIEVACAEAAAWALTLSVTLNLSPVQFHEPDLPAFIQGVLSRTGLPPTRLSLEVTEALLLDDTGTVLATMRALRHMGIRMVLDDFGTAHSNLSYLRGFPFDAVKIDRSFLRAINSDREVLTLVEAILAMARAVGLDVVGEGVETEEQLTLLRNLGCRWVQGYLLGRPAPSAETRQLIWNLATSNARSEKAARGLLPAT